MSRLILFFFVFFFVVSACCAQESGCFKPDLKNELSFKTNIDFSNYNAFFVGEFHGVYGVSEIKLAIIKYLNERYVVRDVFMEIGHSTAWLYNRYLQTGDTSLFSAPVLAYAQKQPNRDFWKNLYNYNKGLAHKITVHGMDFERMNFLKALKLMMLSGKPKPQEIRALLNYIDTVVVTSANGDMHDKEHPGSMLNKIYDSIRQDIVTNKEVYRQYYGEQFKEVEKIMFNENTFARYWDRNKAMYNNVMKEIEENRIKKFIVFSGLNHGDMSNMVWKTLCYRLMKTPSLKHKLVNIAMVCKNCYDWQLQPQYQHAAYRAASAYNKDTTTLATLYNDHYDKTCTYKLLPSEAAGDNKVSNFSHYLILLKGQGEF